MTKVYCKHHMIQSTCEWCRRERQSAGKWKRNMVPRTGLQLKYLRMIIKPADLKVLLKKYVAAKQSVLK